MSSLLHSHCTRSDFGGRVIELAGRVVDPVVQRQGLGGRLLQEYVSSHQPETLVTFTRNPSVIRMIARVACDIYPLENDESSRILAEALGSNATSIEGATYELERYGEEGLFQGFDPADRPYTKNSNQTLKQRYGALASARAALVVVAKIGDKGGAK